MTSRFVQMQAFFLPVAGLALGVSLAAMPAPRSQDAQSAPDNTAHNKDQPKPTADQQGMNASDRAITQKIRKEIHEDSTLSTYAHNAKIITRDGKVTLRGVVRTEDEKNSLQAKAATVVPAENITNNLEVKPK